MRRRTIMMPEDRAALLAIAAAYLGMSGEATIQMFITAGLLRLASKDRNLDNLLSRAGGHDWMSGELKAHYDTMDKLTSPMAGEW